MNESMTRGAYEAIRRKFDLAIGDMTAICGPIDIIPGGKFILPEPPANPLVSGGTESEVPAEPSVESVEQTVLGIVAENFSLGHHQVSPETRCIEDLGLDSLEVTELVIDLEDEWDIDLPKGAFERLLTGSLSVVIEDIKAALVKKEV